MAEEKKRGAPDAGAPAPTISAEIEVEFGDDRNRVFMWGPTMQKLRGFWSRRNLHSDEMVEELGKMPDIPGMRIRLSVERKMAVVYDPLSLPANKEVCETVQRIIFDRWRERQGPEATTERKEMDADDVKTWLYGMRRRYDDGKCRVITGELPTMATIQAMPGRIRIEMFNNSARACRWMEEFNKYIDMIVSGNKNPAVV